MFRIESSFPPHGNYGTEGIMSEERRRHLRGSLMFEIDGRISQANMMHAFLTSVSMVATESIGQVTVGQQILFEIRLPTGSWVPFRSEVVNHWVVTPCLS